jgi:hypothetical protein
MRRAFAIVKYLPAVLCGLLVVAWVVSINYQVEVRSRRPSWAFRLNDFGFYRGSIFLESFYGWRDDNWIESARISAIPQNSAMQLSAFGNVEYFSGSAEMGCQGYYYFGCPILFVLTFLFPLALAPFIRFRFSLWSYFAWTALVAAELAYYLR